MPGDYTRFTHRPERGYSGVRMQQGRVQLDSDWNEQSDIVQRRLRVQAMDTFGRCAVPEPTTPDAFTLAPMGGPPVDLSIGAGRLYIDGLLAEIFDGESYTYRSQKFYPDPPDLPGAADAIAYLDVWEREVTYIEDPDLLEKALGGPDTTTRTQTVWQVKWHQVAGAQCGTDLDALFPPSAGRATTSAIAPPASNDPCILSPSGGYRGLENRLYRVEVHVPGELGTARLKWSRDNGSIVSRVNALAVSGAQTVLTVERIGRDEVLRFDVGDWVEVTDDQRELMGEPGEMALVVDTSEAALTITLDRAIPSGAGRAFGATAEEIDARRTRVRRWDQRAPGNTLDASGLITVDGANLHLEDGVHVQFSLASPGGTFNVGDYWVFAARTADASVEPLTDAPPRGVIHHRCQLATLTWLGDPPELEVDDCRTLWPDPHCCTVSVRPGEDIQRAVDSLPAEGGCVCLLPGVHEVGRPILVDARRNIRIEGIGRASKVVSHPAVAGDTLVHLTGGSRQIRLADFLVFSDDRPALVTISEDAEDVGLSGMTFVNAAPGGESCCVLLAGCSDVTVDATLMAGRVDVLQAGPERLAEVAESLALLRPTETDGEPEEPDGGVEFPEDVETEEPPAPEPSPLQDVTVSGSDLFATEAGIDLQNAVGGLVRENLMAGLDASHLENFRRAGAANVAAAIDLHELLDGNLAELHFPVEAETLQGAAMRGCLVEDFDISRNRVAARRGFDITFARQVTIEANHVRATQDAVRFGYGFECRVAANNLTLPLDTEAPSVTDTFAEAFHARTDAGAVAVRTRFARGLDVEGNTIDAPTAIGAVGSVSTECAQPYPEALLRVMRIGRVWRVVLHLTWLLLIIVRGFWPGFAADVETRADLEDRLYGVLLRFLGNSALLPVFVGKARITENTLQVSRFGIFLHRILTIGGIGITGNRISGFSKAGIFIHPLFSVGLPDRFASWVRCGLQWTIALLRLLRDRLADMLSGEPVVEPAEPTEFNAGTVATTGVAWLLFFCARFCPGGEPSDGTEPGEQPPSPAEELGEALDDLLDHLNPAWLEDLVNQSYSIGTNTLRGTGDGIVTGLDGSHIVGNEVSVDVGNTLAFETLALGLALQQRFGETDLAVPLLAQSLLELDREALLVAYQDEWTSDWMSETHLADEDFRARLLGVVEDVGGVSSPDSPANDALVAIHEGLTAAAPDLARVQLAWFVLILTIWAQLRGFGIVMRGADMVCADNRVWARRGCAPLVRRARFIPTIGGEPTGLTPFLTLTGVPPAVPAPGGIWQFTNLGGWMEDVLAVTVGERGDQSSYYGRLIWALSMYLVLGSVRDRRLAITHNSVEEALAFGIRTLQVAGVTELDIVHNVVREAVRYGLCHRDLGSDERDGEGLHAKVHGNSVVRTSRVFRPEMGNDRSLPADFAALIWLDNRGGRTLCGGNHGDGAELGGQRRAVRVTADVAGVSDNHVEANSELAFEVVAVTGLFTSNMTRPGNDVAPAALRQPPNLETL